MTPQHKEALASMIYGIKERWGFISITGEVGTGKTTLLYTLLNNLTDKVKTVFIYHTDTTFKQLLKNILLELGVKVNHQDKLTLLRELNEYLINQLDHQVTVAVIIDEAQNLSKDVMEDIRMLSNLETCKSKLLQLVLVGQPELEVKLNSEEMRQLKQRIVIRRHIKPLTFVESKQYIDHRLQLVGSSSSSVFTRDAISMICRYSKGIPRNINIICENAFLIGYSLSKKTITAQIIKEVINDMNGSSVPERPRGTTDYSATSFHIVSGAALIMLLFGIIALAGQKFLHPINPDITETRSPKTSTFMSSSPYANSSSESDNIPEKNLASSKQENIHNPGDVSPEDEPLSAPLLNVRDNPEKDQSILATIMAKEGDCISTLGQQYYGTSNETLIDLILSANPKVTNVDKIEIDQEIILPEITPDSFIIKSSDNTYRIHVGTFKSLQDAKTFYSEHSLIGKEIVISMRKVSPENTWYRVEVGDYENRGSCLETIANLKQRGLLSVF
jgi:type II secretory pathway predicted ATPase ExeA/phage tail protein X